MITFTLHLTFLPYAGIKKWPLSEGSHCRNVAVVGMWPESGTLANGTEKFPKKSENCLISEIRTIQPIVQSNRGGKSNETEIDKRFSKMLVCLFSGNSRKY